MEENKKSVEMFFVKKSDVRGLLGGSIDAREGITAFRRLSSAMPSCLSSRFVDAAAAGVISTAAEKTPASKGFPSFSATVPVSKNTSSRTLRKLGNKELSFCMERRYKYERRMRHQYKATMTLKEWMILKEHGLKITSEDLKRKGLGLVVVRK